MTKIMIGFVLGVIISTIGFTGFINLFSTPEAKMAAKIADHKVVEVKKVLKDKSDI